MVDSNIASDTVLKFTMKLKASDFDEMVEVERDVAAESHILAYYMHVFSEKYLHFAHIPIPGVDSETLGKVLRYCKYIVDRNKGPATSTRETWEYEFFSSLDDRMFNNVVLAAAYLQVERLLEQCCNHAIAKKPWGLEAAQTVRSEYLTYWEVVWIFFKHRREVRALENLLAREARKGL